MALKHPTERENGPHYKKRGKTTFFFALSLSNSSVCACVFEIAVFPAVCHFNSNLLIHLETWDFNSVDAELMASSVREWQR